MIRTIARHHIYKDILHPPLERHSRAEKNPTMTKIVLLWLLMKMILNDSYYRWTCASNHFSTVQFVLRKGGTISYDVVTGPRQYSGNLEKLLTKNLPEHLCRKLRGYLISRFNKYPQNPRNFLSSKLISPTVYVYMQLIYTCTLSTAQAFMYDHIPESLSHLFHCG